MDKSYRTPELRLWDNYMEDVYAADSGYVPSTPLVPATPTGDWSIRCEFRNHNSGSHSEVAIICHNNGSKSGDCLIMNFDINKLLCKLISVKDWGGMLFSNISDGGFTITRNNHFNPGENVEFNIQITVKKSDGSTGAYGKTGEFIECPIWCNSYNAL